MTFFKIIQNEQIVNVGCVFLKWNPVKRKMYISTVDDAQFVQTYDEKKIYKATWLNPAPEEAGNYEFAKVDIIDEAEFDELKELISEGETISEEEPKEQYVHTVQHREEPEEKPMTIAQMREMIVEQQKQIETLLQKFQK